MLHRLGLISVAAAVCLVTAATDDTSCANTGSFMSLDAVDGLLACPAMQECVAQACGNASGTMLQASCADYDSSCLLQAAVCFVRQLTNGSVVDSSTPFCSSWKTNATSILGSSRDKRTGACKQVACRALEDGYGSGTLCASNASRSSLTSQQWSTSCDVETAPAASGATTVNLYIALPIVMHTLLSLLLGCGSFFVINTEKLFHEQLLIAFVLLALVFFGGLGVAGLRHRPLYGGTVDCNALSASVALERELAGTAEIISFFSHCDSSRVEMLGFKNGLSGQKCCIPKPKQNTSFTCNHVALVPDLLHNPLAVTDDVHRGIYARCCPSIAGNTVPIGFAAMTVSAVIGIAVNILLNIGTAVVLPKLRKSVCGSGGSSDFKDNVRIGRKTLRFFGKCLQPSVIGTGKLLVSFAVNVISAIGVTAAASGSAWSKYCVFVSVMVNGSFVGNFSDFLCTFLVFEFGNLDSFASRSDKDDLDSFGELLEDVGIRIAAAIVIVYSPFICTHWVPGILTFFPWMAVFAIVAGTAFVLVKLSWQKVSELLELDETPMYGIVAYALLVFAFCLVINMTILQVIRFPVNWSMMLYGETHYPFFAVRPGAGKSEQLADFYAALFHAPFYFLQMSSQSCSLLKSADSAFTHMNTVMMYV